MSHKDVKMLLMDIISRQRAITEDRSKYFTGRPCVNGHIDERYVQSGACKSCIAESSEAHRKFLLWKIKQKEIENQDRMSQKILDEQGVVAWGTWKLRMLKAEADILATREAETGRFKKYLEITGRRCPHQRRFDAPDGSVICRKCGQEVAAFERCGSRKKKVPAFLGVSKQKKKDEGKRPASLLAFLP